MSADVGEQELVTLDDIRAAKQRLLQNKLVVRTPLLREVQAMFPGVEDIRLHLKLENMQTAGSFKIRGVVNQIDHLLETQDLTDKKLVTMSAGNYGKAFAYYLQSARVSGVCVMPVTAPENRVQLIRSLGVEVELRALPDLQVTVDKHVAEEGYVLCHSFDDLHLIAGHASCAMEVLEEGLTPDVVLVCCGGGGLVSGVAAAFHLASPKPVKVYAVEPEGANTMWESYRAGKPVSKEVKSVASGLSPPYAGRLCYAHCKRFVEDVILVSEEEIVQAMHELFERGLKVEPAGCAAMAAILNHRVPEVEGKDVLVIVSGGNVSVQELYQLLPK
ncbi:uncharacterized protein LOC112562733 isoform X1 [Pomacea canaliculata]|uniref:uncharacterized protein LOC112562733 isoform X1 n=1 Tax=Pomacea canaliculata TaxID=400727 RepID=UPI000D72B8B1|nr:uncharacterized protein LOC112562733 isoform X1 [Pomacea canaliculata]